MIYTTGTIAINGNTVTGTGTDFTAPLSLIRVGCTLIAVSDPIQIFTITEIKSGTELSVTPAANPAINAGTKFSILLSDSISVDGLAQDVAETLRYYQSKETEVAKALEWSQDHIADKIANTTHDQQWTGLQDFTTARINSRDFSRRLKLEAAETAKFNSSLSLWGSDSRPSVFEYNWSDPSTNVSAGFGYYCQRNTDDSVLFYVNGVVNCVTLNQSSDSDLKDNIQVIGDATEAIRKMNGYTYTLKENGLPYAGVIAQEVMEALPEAVGSFTHYGKALQGPTIDGNELREETRYLNVDYAAVTGLLVQVARETDNRVTELEEENASLRANIAAMDERIAKLEALVSKLTGSEK